MLPALETELEPITITLDKPQEYSAPTKEITVVNPHRGTRLPVDESLDQDTAVDVLRRGIFDIQSDLSIRGATNEQAVVNVNGVMLNDPQTAHHNMDLAVPEAAVREIQVSQGPSSDIWSQAAIGGALNIITKRPLDTECEASFLYGTDATEKSSVYAAYNTGHAGVNFAAEQVNSDGWRYDTGFREYSFSSSALVEIGDKVSSYIFAGYGEKEFGAADFYGPYNSKEWTDTLFLNWDTGIEVDNLRISPKLYYRSHHDKYMLDIARPDYYLNCHRTVTKGVQLEASFCAERLGLLQAVFDINAQGIDSTRLGDDSRRRSSYSVIWRNYYYEFLGCDASIRIDDYSQYHTEILPQAGVFLKPFQWLKLSGQAAKSARPPNYTELFYDSPSNIGNKDLSPEKAFNYEAGAEVKPGNNNDSLKAAFTIFRRDSYDLIDWIRSPPGAGPYRAQNVTSSRTEGLEAYLDIKLCKWLSLKGGYSYIDSDIDKEGDYTSKYALNHPDHKLFSQAEITLPFGKQNIRFLYKDRKGCSSYAVIGATFNYRLNKHSSLFLIIDNLFDAVYWDIRDNVLPGRQVMAGVCFKF